MSLKGHKKSIDRDENLFTFLAGYVSRGSFLFSLPQEWSYRISTIRFRRLNTEAEELGAGKEIIQQL